MCRKTYDEWLLERIDTLTIDRRNRHFRGADVAKGKTGAKAAANNIIALDLSTATAEANGRVRRGALRERFRALDKISDNKPTSGAADPARSLSSRSTSNMKRKLSRVVAGGVAILGFVSGVFAINPRVIWDTLPAPVGVHHVRVFYSTNSNWDEPTATWVFNRNVTNPPIVLWTNALTGQVTNKYQIALSNLPANTVAAKVSYIYTNGNEAASASERLYAPGNLQIIEVP